MPDPAEWPRVTVQLPVFNEKYILERLLSAITKLNIQPIVSRSRYWTIRLTTHRCFRQASWRTCRRGVNIECVFRTKGADTKPEH